MATLKNTTVDTTGAIQLPVGTTTQRPTASAGHIRYNSTFKTVETYDGTLWRYMPDIVRDGLILHLDASEPDSYPGSGSEWYDLSGNGFHMSLKNSPTYVSGTNVSYFDLDGVDDHGICDGTISNSVSATVSNLGLGGTNQKTVVCFAMVDNNVGSNSGGLFDLGDTGVSGRHYCLRLNSSYTAWRAQFWGTPDYDFTYDTLGSWTMFSVVYGSDKIGKTYGNNSILLGQDASAFNLVTAGSRPFEMARYNGGSYFGGKISAYLVYNKGLSTQEIQQNFNALKSRFGL